MVDLKRETYEIRCGLRRGHNRTYYGGIFESLMEPNADEVLMMLENED